MYVAVKGGEKAIENAHGLLAEERRGDVSVPELTVDQIEQQMGLAVDRVMNEGALYDRRLAAIAVKQAQGDLPEAVFLLRAYRTTLPRIGFSLPMETSAMHLRRRISATFKDLPGGQMLGPTYDYTHRLLDFSLERPRAQEPGGGDKSPKPPGEEAPCPRVSDLLAAEGLMAAEETGVGDEVPGDLTRQPLKVPAERPVRLQNLARGDEGFLLSIAYSAQRGFGTSDHPFAGEIRMGEVAVEMVPEELGFPVVIGEITVTECVMITPPGPSKQGEAPALTQGYGLAFGHSERKAMAMAIVDRTLCSRELGEKVAYPAQDEEFVLCHSDSLEASGFVQHLKLPHYVDFQSELVLLRDLRNDHREGHRTRDAIPN
ncbi:carbon-phosphorus lyase complex subunit PhnI [Desulfoluna spongiiphila]|uniref:carbon-phosphorus lyase complex subunit PhnI n=1 Tax=Desulfoluna spongiiphila TaxID=419481 RepID=UPI001251C1B8|nr:carbon-phosphorus lyase complex subunit PhnI [Desulfoluna spongiiphila]VVS91480.1 phosphonate metabolism protein phni [Desulfoluna spongiiphila]